MKYLQQLVHVRCFLPLARDFTNFATVNTSILLLSVMISWLQIQVHDEMTRKKKSVVEDEGQETTSDDMLLSNGAICAWLAAHCC